MMETTIFAYENLYYELWETARRYRAIAQFRVIGNSHDERMIPMIEVGQGDQAIFCVSGLNGTERHMPSCLLRMAKEYCRAWECGWVLEELYDVKQLLSAWKICFIPLLNPDGYEIYEKGYTVIRNPVYRQMLRMQETACTEYFCNARGMNLQKNFPTSYYRKMRIYHEPASENETKALVRILQEYQGKGFFSFGQADKRIVYFRQPQSFGTNQKSYRLARHFQKQAGFCMEKFSLEQQKKEHAVQGEGTPERYYAELTRQPSFRIELPSGLGEEESSLLENRYQQIYTIPLEYIFSVGEL